MRSMGFLAIVLLVSGCLGKLETLTDETRGHSKDISDKLTETELLQTRGGSLGLLPPSPRHQVLASMQLILKVTKDDDVHRYVGAQGNLYKGDTYLNVSGRVNTATVGERMDPFLPLVSPISEETFLLFQSAILVAGLQLVGESNLDADSAIVLNRLFRVAPAVLGARRIDYVNHKVEADAILFKDFTGPREENPYEVARVCVAKLLLQLESKHGDRLTAESKEQMNNSLEPKLQLKKDQLSRLACPIMQ